MGNTVSRYTRSPSAAVLVLMLLIMLSGMRVPTATTKSSGLAASVLVAGVVAAGAGAAGAAGTGAETDSEAGDSGAGACCWALRAATAASVMKAERTYIGQFLLSSLNADQPQRVSAACFPGAREGLGAFLGVLFFVAVFSGAVSCGGPNARKSI